MLNVKVHYLNQNDSTIYEGVQDYSYSHITGLLTLTPVTGGAGSNFGSSAITVNVVAGVLRVEIFPSVTQFPGNTTGTASG